MASFSCKKCIVAPCATTSLRPRRSATAGRASRPLRASAVEASGDKAAEARAWIEAWRAKQNSPTFAPTSSRVDSALQQGITIQLRKSQEVKLKQGIKSKVSDAEEKVKADGVVEPEVLTDEQKMAVSMSSVEVQKKLRENVGDIPTAQLWSAISRQLQQSGSPLDSTKQQADMPDSDGAVAAKGAPDSEPSETSGMISFTKDQLDSFNLEEALKKLGS